MYRRHAQPPAPLQVRTGAGGVCGCLLLSRDGCESAPFSSRGTKHHERPASGVPPAHRHSARGPVAATRESTLPRSPTLHPGCPRSLVYAFASLDCGTRDFIDAMAAEIRKRLKSEDFNPQQISKYGIGRMGLTWAFNVECLALSVSMLGCMCSMGTLLSMFHAKQPSQASSVHR